MGYAFGGICHQDTASALQAFVAGMSAGDAAGITTFDGAPSITGTGLVSWSIEHRPLTSDTATLRSGTTQLPPCTEGISQWSESSLLLVCALFFAAMMGFRAGFRP